MRYPRDVYAWIDPFEAIDDMVRYIEEREDELDRRTRWALMEVGRQRSLCDQALHDALQKYAPQPLEPRAATILMDSAIASLFPRA